LSSHEGPKVTKNEGKRKEERGGKEGKTSKEACSNVLAFPEFPAESANAGKSPSSSLFRSSSFLFDFNFNSNRSRRVEKKVWG
jgi:hypothetical protein